MYKILIIEDDVVIRAELKTLFEKYGYKPVVTDFEESKSSSVTVAYLAGYLGFGRVATIID